MIRKCLNNKPFLISFIVLLPIIILALIGPWIVPHNPLTINPQKILLAYSPGYIFGTDEYGRDVFSRLIVGIRPSFIVALGSTAIALVMGMFLGVIAGYIGGKVDQAIMRVVDLILCFPSILLALMIVSFWGTGIRNLIITIGIVYIPTFARLANASTKQVKKQEYITAEISLGARFGRIVFKDILPNIMSSIIVQISLTFANAILLESGLSFLGLGVVPPTPSLGQMIGEARGYMTMNPMFIIWPSIFLGITILFANIMGDSLRDILDPRLHTQ